MLSRWLLAYEGEALEAECDSDKQILLVEMSSNLKAAVPNALVIILLRSSSVLYWQINSS